MYHGCMNYLAHAMPFLDEPYFAAGSCVPDWLTVADRKVRVRSKHAAPFVEDRDRIVAAVAGGILQHIRDDALFHGSRAFAELCLQLTAMARDALDGETGLRPAFLGHLLAEVLLDATLAAENPARLEALYETLARVDPQRVEAAVNRMAPRPTERLSPMIRGFCREKILWDYFEDAKLLHRLSQVMRRVRLDPLPESFGRLLAEVRPLVAARKNELLEGIPTQRT